MLTTTKVIFFLKGFLAVNGFDSDLVEKALNR